MIFTPRTSIAQVEEGTDLAPKFDTNGCLPCITLSAETREVLMFAFMNEEALKLPVMSATAVASIEKSRFRLPRTNPPG
jgi:phosphoribosyl-AMP cyclohydrolase